MLHPGTRQFLRLIYDEMVNSVKPRQLIASQLQVINDKLIINGHKFPLDKNCYVIGFGKAVYEMGQAVHNILNHRIIQAIYSVPFGSVKTESKSNFNSMTNVRVFEGAVNNIPDENSLRATNKIIDLVNGLTQDDLLIVLISGGGSALLVSPIDGICLSDKINVIKQLSRAGADITELNSVRKALSNVKGGKLAAKAYPATIISLILSDIVGDPLEYIASGPTTSPTQDSIIYIIDKYHINLPISIKETLSKPEKCIEPEIFKNTHNFIIGNNCKALESGKNFIKSNNKSACILTSRLEGLVQNVANSLSNFILQSSNFFTGRISENEYRCSVQDGLEVLSISQDHFDDCVKMMLKENDEVYFLLGGETTVLVQGRGLGGRNMELAIRISNHLSKVNEENFKIGILCAGTDGIDGPTDAAGAFSYPTQSELAQLQNLSLTDFIENNDSYGFLKKMNEGEDLVQPGHTGTNVMDVIVVSIKKNIHKS